MGACRFTSASRVPEGIALDAQSGAVRVRYCWDDNPACAVVNAEGLPAVPFDMRLP
jgi:sialate O-acetylesterase